MATVFLLIIYITFISLGLPDSLLGVGWPEMRLEFGVATSYAGLISMTISGGTIISSMLSGKLIRRFGTGKLTAFSVLATALALLGFSVAPHFYFLLLLALPLGLGAGAVDAALNDYVAVHYTARHMNWLHSFWGVGALTSPLIMARVLEQEASWRQGYLSVAVIQFLVVVLLLLSLPLWRRREGPKTLSPEKTNAEGFSFRYFLSLKKVRLALYGYFFYIGIEATVGLWTSSYLINVKDIPSAQAALAVSLFFAMIMIGRFISGVIAIKLSNQQLIRLGQLLIVAGSILLLVSSLYSLLLLSIALIGLGCAPIFPAMLHETPRRFGQDMAQQVMGIQMGIAYTGSILLPPLFGFVAPTLGMGILPIALLAYAVVMLLSTESLTQQLAKK